MDNQLLHDGTFSPNTEWAKTYALWPQGKSELTERVIIVIVIDSDHVLLCFSLTCLLCCSSASFASGCCCASTCWMTRKAVTRQMGGVDPDTTQGESGRVGCRPENFYLVLKMAQAWFSAALGSPSLLRSFMVLVRAGPPRISLTVIVFFLSVPHRVSTCLRTEGFLCTRTRSAAHSRI